mmetsp:Transcript_14788/g.33956  ORF Transcript_14788/g.33956 Transcript_14788/m.33956 type:complete len:129 (+) Transcript_14788:197-583(+)
MVSIRSAGSGGVDAGRREGSVRMASYRSRWGPLSTISENSRWGIRGQKRGGPVPLAAMLAPKAFVSVSDTGVRNGIKGGGLVGGNRGGIRDGATDDGAGGLSDACASPRSGRGGRERSSAATGASGHG